MREKWRCPFCERVWPWPTGNVDVPLLTTQKVGLRCRCGALARIEDEVDPDTPRFQDTPLPTKIADDLTAEWQTAGEFAVYRFDDNDGKPRAVLVEWLPSSLAPRKDG